MKNTLTFYKYHGAGNDFIIVDYASLQGLELSAEMVTLWCKRRYGIGADGLMVFKALEAEQTDFEMQYFNADGSTGMMCGNGGRCIALYAHEIQGVAKQMKFRLGDSVYEALIQADQNVALSLPAVTYIKKNIDLTYFCDTGSPHHIEWVSPPLKDVAVHTKGRELRNRYGSNGCNVNFVEVLSDDHLAIRTYERGVEDETHACGTGVTAAAICAHHLGKVKGNSIKVSAIGGELKVQFQETSGTYNAVILQGPAQQVYQGTLLWP